MIEPTKKLNFKLSPAHASAFYVYLMKLPIDVDLVWANNFRQQLCDLLHQQLFFDRHVDIESVPVTLADYEFGE
jgi:hypothetical protein